MNTIEYFYAAHSAFAYLGSARFTEIARAAGRRIVHKPFDLRSAVEAVGSVPFAKRTAAQRAYFFGREIQRWSEERDAPVMDGSPSHHQKDMTLPNCVLIAAAARQADPDRLAHAFLEAHWRDDADLASKGTLEQLVRVAGIDPAPLLEAAGSVEIRAMYEANTAEAIARSVFGSPTYFVDGDMFYGQDRLEMVERALSKPYRGA